MPTKDFKSVTTAEDCIPLLRSLMSEARFTQFKARHSLAHALEQRVADTGSAEVRDLVAAALAAMFDRIDLRRGDEREIAAILDLCVVFRDDKIGQVLRRKLLGHTRLSRRPFFGRLVAACLKCGSDVQLLDFVYTKLPRLQGFERNALAAVRGLSIATNTCALDYLATMDELLADSTYSNWCLLAYIDVTERVGFPRFAEELWNYVSEMGFAIERSDCVFLERLVKALGDANPDSLDLQYCRFFLGLQRPDRELTIAAVEFVRHHTLLAEQIVNLSELCERIQFSFKFDTATAEVKTAFAPFEVSENIAPQNGIYLPTNKNDFILVPPEMVRSRPPAARIYKGRSGRGPH